MDIEKRVRDAATFYRLAATKRRLTRRIGSKTGSKIFAYASISSVLKVCRRDLQLPRISRQFARKAFGRSIKRVGLYIPDAVIAVGYRVNDGHVGPWALFLI